MSNEGIHTKLITLFSLLLTILFVYTAVSKVVHLDTFQWRLERMPYISPYASMVSWGVPFLELVIAGLLWFPGYQIKALYGSFFLLGCFTIYITLILKFSDSIPCSCGGALSFLGWKEHILFNGVCMAMALWAIILYKKQYRKTFLDQNTT